MASTDARPVPRKGVAYRVTFPIFDADGDLVTGAASLDSEVSKDAGAYADCTNEATEIATASGTYYLDLTATEMDADTVAIIVKTGTAGAKTTPIFLYPEEVGDFRIDETKIDAIDNFLDTEIAAILEDTGTTLDDFVDDLEGRLTAALATALAAHALGVGRGVVDASSTTTAVIFKSVNGAAASAVNDFYNGRHIVFTSGALALQACSISDYDGATKTATVPALTGAPAEDVTFVIV